ncbi:hypothetical protein H6P81_015537 [Aristolochia fimbriata]|uniref:5' exonuclease Apollo n=1 Tax=Aristolochia fimbriata TaxID=158543 RepID=A0AAV7E8Z4_ARIFI|nr:hypothetical protein H6P81_015537 [Aristolochia fimbriata]
MDQGLISVDKWGQPSQAYFLTHLHADHTQGLSRRWKKGPLFCSPITRKLFPATFPGFDLSLLRVLEIGSTSSIRLVSETSRKEILVEVTTIDANHCPGAVMYLFQGEFGSFLFTGDFRWDAESQRGQQGKDVLMNALNGRKLDFLYIDNTYCNPSFCFPPRAIAAKQVVDIIASHPLHDIIISISNLGKEDLLVHVAHALNIKIWVWPERLQTMHLLGYGDIFTKDTGLTRVRAVPRYNCTIDTLVTLNTVKGPTIGIIPSGLPWGICSKNKQKQGQRICIDKSQLADNSSSARMLHQYLYCISYSDHSCFNEIQELITILRPTRMRGIVSSSFCYVNPVRYFGQLCGTNQNNDPSSSTSTSEVKDVEVRQADSFSGWDVFHRETETSATAANLSYRSVKRRRVSQLRRERSGAKIAYTDDDN